jgi:NADPH-dependent 2,4-dienoyl-CoA reductase/sulfur reductase-like enzyme/rhodanese-related sulfurtransferase
MRIIVVGGVAGGASAAARLRRLDESAEIILLERDGYVSFANCGLPYHIGRVIEERDNLLVQTPEDLHESLNLDVRVRHEVVLINRESKTVTVRDLGSGEETLEPYDKLVLSQGAVPFRPPIPGVDHPRVFVLRNIPDMDAIIAALTPDVRRTAIIGAGYIGVEVAENFRHVDLEVDLVEQMDQIIPTLDPEMARDLEYHMQSHGVRLHLGTAAQEIRERNGGLTVSLANGTALEVDLLVLAVGIRPETTLARQAGLELGETGGVLTDAHMRTSDPDIYAVGDMIEVCDTAMDTPAIIALAGPANRQGRIAADHIAGRDSRYTTSQGTSVVLVFEAIGGGTGATERALKRAGVPYRKVYLHPSNHASYYPGAQAMHMKILFSPDDGRLLGAQVVGFEGVDKRIDVLATALRAGLTVFDLEHLELAYAPPFGSAKDPVNMAGFIASNLLRGDVHFWYPEDHPEKTRAGVMLDVRDAGEFDEWHIADAVNIPQRQLRERLGELPRDQPIYCYCRSGLRSYLAYRLLVQSGFEEAYTLSGGGLTFGDYERNIYATGEPHYPVIAHAEHWMAQHARGSGS